MSFGVGDLTGLVGLAVVGAVAVKTIDVVGKSINNASANVLNQKKKKSKKKSKSNNIFDMGMNFNGNKKSSKKMKGADNIFSTGFGF